MLSRAEIDERLATWALDNSQREALETAQKLGEWLEKVTAKTDGCSCPTGEDWQCADCQEALWRSEDWVVGEGSGADEWIGGEGK